MCGIAGIFHLETAKPVDPDRIRLMTDTLAHRGPDGSGVWTAQGVGLGHRRLSIIDLETGAQPMATPDGKLVTVFNGEIYNYRALRLELQAQGHVFQTDSDTEVILHGWRQWGPLCIEHFDGMFAFALYDDDAKTLYLGRDRLGVKPLYYAEVSDGSLIFASELKGLLAHPLLRRRPSEQAVEDFLAFGYVPDDACFVAGIKKLPAGHYLMTRRGLPLAEPRSYWDVAFAPKRRKAEAAEEELASLMGDAVRSRMIADVPLGAFLSGGVDSSSVVAFMAEASRGAVETCSIGFDQADLDETAYADQIAERFATNHRKRIVAADDFALIDTLVSGFDEPFADASALPTYRVCELAREKVTVSLSGDGADEIFAGYRRHVFHAGEERARTLLPAAVRQPVFGTLGSLYPKLDWAPQFLRAKSTFQSLGRTGAEAYADSVGVTGSALRQSLYSDTMRAALQGHRAEDRYIRMMESAPAEDGLAAAQYADLKIWLPGDILTKVDRMSMAVSLEAREPLLDHRLVEFAATLPLKQRVRGGTGKWLMKQAMRRYLPEDILFRRKMGFVTPISAWFRGPLAGEADRLVSSTALAETEWFDRQAIKRIVDAHKSGREEHGRLIWQLMMLDRSLQHVFGAGR
ncbi:XrtA/PEP-CTERM system amidotransferase [Parasphingopyxis lamellibrachiae]|uniref:asparagine synthase (glutamine-hydrolyzing) n=1 Tax=Parasphingopyxis lamellibrachiae TaxID=680125 RepID=A0A3D9FDL5_9SPHN|nr:XrtA/PEP-CTERM system amidotransferase [Parasphingopyxis lamellibrachiae]RED15662.1 asparagine synthase (glutamine-hydrolysing) [Parasphingopyxis lamellibrachiae]